MARCAALPALVVAVAVAAGGCGGVPRPASGTPHEDARPGARAVSLVTHDASPLADSPVEVDVRGLRGGGRAALHARWREGDGTVWVSDTPLHADARGRVVLRGVDGTRFLWSMRPAHPTGDSQSFMLPVRGRSDVALTVEAAGRVVARATLPRRLTSPGVRVRRLTVRRDGVSGYLFSPAGHARGPAVLAFGGSEGGDSMIAKAALLASHGYPALALAYFKAPGLPRRLVRIPLEYFARAAHILRRSPGVDPSHLVTLGVSYGGEASLLVASSFPALFHGAIALVPSAIVTSGLPFGNAAWTLHGRAVPDQAPIAVERIDGPVLTAGAGREGIWNSAGAVTQVEQRLTAHHFRFGHRGIVYPDAGHVVGGAVPYSPAPTTQPAEGGDPRADAAGRADLWPRILGFLDRLRAR